MLFRCSSIGKLMTEPKTKAEGPLSVGAKTYIRTLAAQSILGIDFEVTSKEMEKGLLVEQQAIELLNRVRGLDLEKNTERRDNEWLTGECDLFNSLARRGHDLKCSWSAATFPITVADCKDSLYEWQMRGYMMLWDADEWEVNYALITTPEALTKWEPLFMHFVDHIPEHMRLTSWVIQRDAEKEARMVEKVKHARAYFAEVVEEFAATHQPTQTIHLLPAGAAMNDDQPESTEQDAERERIRAEEAARLEREAAAKAAAEKAEADRLERERAHAAQVEAQRIQDEQAELSAMKPILQSIARETVPLTAAEIEEAEAARGLPKDNGIVVVIDDRRLSQSQLDKLYPMTPADFGQIVTDNGPRLTLGQLNERLSPVSISVAGLSLLGFDPVEQVKASRFYRECDLPAICKAISAHVLAACSAEAA